MKKLKLIILIIVIISSLFILTGCMNTESEAKEKERLVYIWSKGIRAIYYDEKTKVEYLIIENVGNRGYCAIQVLVDAEGKPLLYEGE